MLSPRNSTLGEEIYKDIEQNEYFNEIFTTILHKYSDKVFHKSNINVDNLNLDDALRFADILSKSAGMPNSEKHKALAQEMMALLVDLFPDNPKVEYYMASVLSTIGNYRGLQLMKAHFNTHSFLEMVFANFDKNYLAIPHQDNKYFFHSQKAIYNRLDDELFSYSGPTSMGKSLLMRMFIKEQIVSGHKENYAIIIPTKALVSEITSSIIQDLTTLLEEKDYKVVNSAGSSMLEEQHNFIFILTPERLLYLLISNPTVNINYLFIDEAHKISANDGRSAFYYKIVDMLQERENKPHVIFASPNIPNPDIYLQLIHNAATNNNTSISTRYSPVSQLIYLVDMVDGKISLYNETTKKMSAISNIKPNVDSLEVVEKIIKQSPGKQSIVYSNSKDKAIDMAIRFSKQLQPKNDPALNALAKEIKNEIHDTYYLADLIKCGIAYHVGYLPNHIRTSIEKCFREHKIDVLFCTSTLVEGVNLPADNLFIMSRKNGLKDLSQVDFKNLIGRVGRIEYNLFGNVFVFRNEAKTPESKYLKLIESNVPEQKISLVSTLTRAQKACIVESLLTGNIEFPICNKNQTNDEYSLMRKFGLILLRDIIRSRNSVVKDAFKDFLSPETEATIRKKFNYSVQQDDDINISVDQTKRLTNAIANGLSYPQSSNGTFNYAEMISFLYKLADIFKWEKYEPGTLGHRDEQGQYSFIRWYATILIQWMEGKGLNNIISEAIRYKQKHKTSQVKINNILYTYDDSRLHKNAVIAETLTIIDNVVLFSLANYFLRFSTVYKQYHNMDSFENDWYEYVEYGSTNKLTILLQRNGFSREASEYIKQNKNKYVIDTPTGPKLSNDLLCCHKESIKYEIKNIQFNVPELFIEKPKI